MANFFISYTEVDRAWAEWIAWVLEDAGYTATIAAWDFQPGTNFRREMNEASQKADKTIAVLSKAYFLSTHATDEAYAALAKNGPDDDRKLIPVRIEKFKPEGSFAAIVYVDFVGLGEEKAKQVLLAALNGRGKPERLPTFPGRPKELIPDFPSEPNQVNVSSQVLSHLQIIANVDNSPANSLILIEPGIAKDWDVRPIDICAYQNKSLYSMDVSQLGSYNQRWEDITCVSASDIFLPELTFVAHTGEAIPGGVLPETAKNLRFNGEEITVLIPLNPILLKYLSPEYIQENLQFKMLFESEPRVEVSLRLLLTGIEQPASYTISHEYHLRQKNALTAVPILEFWPNIKSNDWHEYYAFYYDAELGEETFDVIFEKTEEMESVQDERNGSFKIAKFESFPAFITCTNNEQQTAGLIFLKQPPEISHPDRKWKIGIDFGTAFTNIYVEDSGLKKRLEFKNLHLNITDSPLETRLPVLLEYFLPEKFIPVDKPLPLANYVTRQGAAKRGERTSRRIIDERIYFPKAIDIDMSAEWMTANLRWSDTHINRLFLEQLVLLISALALNGNAKEIEWFVSYPSGSSWIGQNNYAITWNDILKDISQSTGVSSVFSSDSSHENYRPENLAVAQYFVNHENLSLDHATCIDIGAGKSDISIWEDNCLLYQSSVKFSSQELLSNILEKKPEFMSQMFSHRDNAYWRKLPHDLFNFQLEIFLRWHCESYIQGNHLLLGNKKDFRSLIAMICLGFGGLHYYIGFLLKVLREEGLYKSDEITSMYFAGNGARIVNWLDRSGKFSKSSEVIDLLRKMLSDGSGLKNIDALIHLSKNPKDEVACGLLLDSASLKVSESQAGNDLIPGEAFEIYGNPIAANERILHRKVTEGLQISEFNQLIRFVYDYHAALKTLEIDDIEPLEGYVQSLSYDENFNLWQGTRRELDQMIIETRHTKSSATRSVEPPFILCLRAMLTHLAKEWSNTCS